MRVGITLAELNGAAVDSLRLPEATLVNQHTAQFYVRLGEDLAEFDGAPTGRFSLSEPALVGQHNS